MRVMAQMAMVMNLDKCIGCHTCSVTCKQTWANRTGVEYAWFNNVETKPGVGYPRRYEDQERWKGGWMLDKRGRLVLRSGGRVKRLLSLFSNPDLPAIEDYYEPVTYDYDNLVSAPAGQDIPVARPRSVLTGKPTSITWGANWEDGLGGAPEHAGDDPNLSGGWAQKVKFEFEQTFLFHLPRLCEHCLNPACVAACPSGALYKRVEDGIVLVDQNRCRGWRMCVLRSRGHRRGGRCADEAHRSALVHALPHSRRGRRRDSARGRRAQRTRGGGPAPAARRRQVPGPVRRAGRAQGGRRRAHGDGEPLPRRVRG